MTGAPPRFRPEELPDLRQLADLEPLSTGDLIDRAVHIYRRNFTPLLALAVLPVIASCVGTLLVAYAATGLRESAATLPVVIVGMSVGYVLTYVISPLLLMLITGGLTRAVADFAMLDAPISLRRAWRMMKGRLWPLLWTQIAGYLLFWLTLSGLALVGLFIFWIAILAAFLLFGYLPSTLAGGLFTLLMAALVALGFVGYCAAVTQIALVPSVAMIEGRSMRDSLIRAMQLARGAIWRVVQITLFDMAIASSVISAIGVPLLIYVILNGDFDDLTRTPTWFLLAFSVADQLGKLVTLPMSTIAYCLLYFDMRVRREGYDVELLSARLAGAEPDRSPRRAGATAPPRSIPPLTVSSPSKAAVVP
ncbi:MAG: hypothetical protein CFK52_03960 [Chloracidobacterium sp. CP2_5A]|nr:MAG: hypothetical protein CFK52_03960 [Chloracidobacterium sp. CP2_5A]